MVFSLTLDVARSSANSKMLELVLNKLVKNEVLPDKIAKTVLAKGSNLAHLNGLPKTQKPQLAMRPILSAVGTYNYKLAKPLHEKLKPLSINRYTISNILEFAEHLATSKVTENTIMASYDVTALFTNIPVDKTIDILIAKVFQNNWFNVTHNLYITRSHLKQLLKITVKNQLFQFNGQLYEQRDGVAMGSPLGPLMANSFLFHIEENLDQANKLPSLYKQYVDDTLAFVDNIDDAESFLHVLNEAHPHLEFTMELAVENSLPFMGIKITKIGCTLQTEVL
ncbi:uncharacterized protein [Montipora foliosa]|uniref:uncharacterized protein n=1 Tax=Montipora foliosa TaxID=591990 RepID=UPI0035F1E5DF